MPNQTRAARDAIAEAEAAEQRAARAMQAYKARLKGMSWFDIAEDLELPEAQIRELHAEAIRAASELYLEGSKRQLLDLELARLDALQAAHWDSATEPRTTVDKDGNLITLGADVRAGEFVLKVIDKRVKLQGLEDLTHGDISTRTVIIAGDINDPGYLAALKELAGPPKTISAVEGQVERLDLDDILDADDDDDEED